MEVIPETPDGDMSISGLERLITGSERFPALIAITHIPTSSGEYAICELTLGGCRY